MLLITLAVLYIHKIARGLRLQIWSHIWAYPLATQAMILRSLHKHETLATISVTAVGKSQGILTALPRHRVTMSR
jgi:hypothetical protein